MRGRGIQAGLIVLFFVSVMINSGEVRAQDKGPPALRLTTLFTAGGAVGGAALGVAVWMLDPLSPSADLRGSTAQGAGVGCIAGFVFGIMQLNKQAVLPYSEPDAMGGIGKNDQTHPAIAGYASHWNRAYSHSIRLSGRDISVRGIRPLFKPAGVPIIGLRYRF